MTDFDRFNQARYFPEDAAQDEARDDQQQATYGQEREQYEMSLAALYECAMRGVSEEMLRWLCNRCGIEYVDIIGYVQPVLRPKGPDLFDIDSDPF